MSSCVADQKNRLQALDGLHSQQRSMCDIKPENIRVKSYQTAAS